MANETTLVFETSLPIPFTCADNTGIEKGAILALTDPMTVATSGAANDIFGGIAAEEKIANDGKTKIAVYRDGIFKVTIGGAASASTIGSDCVIMGINLVTNFTTLDGEKGESFGKFLETGTAGETVLLELGR
jgi:hypothetical protein